MKYYGVDPQKAEDRIRKADKQRASYYNYYATATWGDVNNYDLCVDTGKLGVEGTVELHRPLRRTAAGNAGSEEVSMRQNSAPRGAAGADDDARVRSRVGIWRY